MKINRRQFQAAAELTRRQNDGLALFRSLPHQDEFFRSDATEILVRGGNRSGKSTVTAVRTAAIARDMAVTLSDGSVVQQRLSHQKGRPLLIWVIGIQANHIGATLHRLLFKPASTRSLGTRRRGTGGHSTL